MLKMQPVSICNPESGEKFSTDIYHNALAVQEAEAFHIGTM